MTESFVDGAERQGAYGLLESAAVSAAEIGKAMFEAAARRSGKDEYVFCVVDGTSLTLVDLERTKGFGPIGNRSKRGRGLKVMNAMLLNPNGITLGISSQRWWARSERRRRKHRDQLRPEQKETHRWIEAIGETREVMRKHAPGTRVWFQLDREGDAWPIITTAGEENHWFTIRASHERRVILPDGTRSKLHKLVAQQPIIHRYDLEVRGTAKRQGRTAAMHVRACTMTLEFRDKRNGRRFTKPVNVVQAIERGTVPRAEKPITWTLLTNRPLSTEKAVNEVIKGYSMRWRIEELHRTWKSGACRVEESQLRSVNAAVKWATILIAVAARIERIKQLSREEPDRPATDEFTPLEIKAAVLLRFGKTTKTRIPTAPTIAEVTLWVAQLGGYTGKTSSGGPPGSITLARGLNDVRAAAKALEALQ